MKQPLNSRRCACSLSNLFRRIGWTVLAFCLFLSPVSAQPDTRSLLDALRKQLLGGDRVTVRAELAVEADRGVEVLRTPATVVLQGVRYRVETDLFAYYADGKSVWFYDPGTGEVTVAPQETDYGNVLENPFAVLDPAASGHFLFPDRPDRSTEGGEPVWSVTVRPRDGNGMQLTVSVRCTDGRLVSIRGERGKERVDLRVTGQETAAPGPESDFTPSAELLSGVEVIDLR